MTNPDLDSLYALDWQTITCQCPIHHCKYRAAHVVELHALHRCNDPDVNMFGNHIELLCSSCLAALKVTIRAELTQLSALPLLPQCDTCGAPVTQVGDVIRAVSRL